MNSAPLKIGSRFALAAAAGAAAAWMASRVFPPAPERKSYWQKKVVLITGGSRGLGLELAREFLSRGARVAICARNQSDIDYALPELRARGEAIGVACDVTSREQVQNLIDTILQRWKNLDAVVNNAGAIQVGPLESMTLDDFRAAMDVHFWGALYVIDAALPLLKTRRGNIVNITSVGGEIAVPHLLPYSASKFAAVGLSEGLRAELAAKHVAVTTVCPGLMRTGSPRNALFKGRHRAEHAWFTLGDSLPFLSMNSRRAAARIVNAAERRQAYLSLTLPAKIGIGLHGLFPGLTARILGLVNRLLPGPGGIRKESRKGHESESAWAPSVLTKLSDKAAVRNNETTGR